MSDEKWIIHPGESRVIDLPPTGRLKASLVGGQIDVVAHDEDIVRIEVHEVSGKDLRIESRDGLIEIDHPQLRWDNFLDVFRSFGEGAAKAEISVAVPRQTALTLGVVSASALVTGLGRGASLNTVSGDLIIDGVHGDLSLNSVSGDLQARALAGALSANTVSGDIAAEGALTKASVDTVSGSAIIDANGPVTSVSVNTVTGAATVRLDAHLAANYVARSASGRITVDGEVRASSIPASYIGSAGELSGSFADVRLHSVSGALTVVRRADAAPAPTDTFEAEA